MLRKFAIGLVAVAGAALLGAPASADVLGLLRSGPLSGTSGSGASSWTNLHASVGNNTSYTIGAGLTYPAGTTFTRYTVAGTNNWVSESASITNNDFVTWHLEFNQAWNLDDLTIGFARNSTTGPNAMSLQLSINNGAYTTVYTDTGGVVTSGAGGEFHTVNLSAFDNVTVARFRAVLWSATSTLGQFTFMNTTNDSMSDRSFRLQATAVPEPATLGLVALAGIALLRRRQA